MAGTEEKKYGRNVLVCGLGGIGGRVVGTMMKKLDAESKNRCRVVCFDTDSSDLEDLRNDFGITGIQTSSTSSVDEYLKSHPEFEKWFMRNPLLAKRTMLAGAGQVREISRLAADAKLDEIRTVLKNAIDELLLVDGNPYETSLKVVIVCSITGGTGAGLCVQLPMIIRDIAKKNNNVSDLIIRGLFIGPDISKQYATHETNINSLYANAFAVIKEINAFYDAQMKRPEEIPFELPNYEKRDGTKVANDIPYDFVFYVTKSTAASHNLGDASEYTAAVAQILYQQMFTGMSGPMFSSEDNMILEEVRTKGMSRFGGAGTSKAVFPADEITDYIALRWNNENLGRVWYKIDKQIKSEIKEQKDNPDPEAPEVNVPRRYVELFDQYSKEDKSFSAILKTFNKREKSVDGAESRVIRYHEECLRGIVSDTLNEVRSGEFVPPKGRKTLCEQILENDSSVFSDEISYLISLKNQLSEKVLNLKQSLPNKFLPMNQDADFHYTESTRSSFIPKQLHNLHPIAVRYILSYLYNSFEDKIIEYKNKIKRYNIAAAEDNNGRICADIDHAKAAIKKSKQFENDKEKLFEENLVNDMIDWEKASKISSEMQDYCQKVNNALEVYYHERRAVYGDDSQRKNYLIPNNYYEHQLLISVLTSLKERVGALLAVYTDFFDAIPALCAEKDAELAKLKKIHNGVENDGIFPGTKYICANDKCKDALYTEVSERFDEDALPEEALNSLFNYMYFRGVTHFFKARQDKSTLKANKKQLQALEAGYIKLYNKSVMPPMTEKIKELSKDCLPQSVCSAIVKEYVIENTDAIFGSTEDDSPSEAEQLKLIRETLRSLRVMAVPFFYSGGQANRSEHVYVCINPSDFKNSAKELPEVFAELKDNESDGIIAKDVFDKNIIYFYRACYLYEAYEIDSFKSSSYDGRGRKAEGVYSGSDNARDKYSERIDNIRSNYKLNCDADTYQDFVSPHLDKRWCQPYYMPDIDPEIAFEERYNGYLAFLLAVEYDYSFLMQRTGVDGSKGGYFWQNRGMELNSFLKFFGEEENFEGKYINLLKYARSDVYFSEYIVNELDYNCIRPDEKNDFTSGKDKFAETRPAAFFIKSNEKSGYEKGEKNNSTPNVLELIEKTGYQANDNWLTMSILVKVLCKYLVNLLDDYNNNDTELSNKAFDEYMKTLVEAYNAITESDDTDEDIIAFKKINGLDKPIEAAKKQLLSILKDVDSYYAREIDKPENRPDMFRIVKTKAKLSSEDF